jgi:hypothetical protein
MLFLKNKCQKNAPPFARCPENPSEPFSKKKGK